MRASPDEYVSDMPSPFAPFRASRAFVNRSTADLALDRIFGARIRHQHALAAATENGRQLGMRAGYTQGWYWGLTCGVVAGALATLGVLKIIATVIA